MLSIIYGHDLGAPESIAWLLCQEENIGPQIFKFDSDVNNANRGRLFNKVISDNRESKYFDDHYLCMQRMENLTNGSVGKLGPSQPELENESVDFISHYRKYEEQFEHVVWANYFGRTSNIYSRIEGADKVVICRQPFIETFTHYITGYAFGEQQHSDIDTASKIWYEDHHHLDGQDTTRWKEYWYRLYHKKMHDAFDAGELKYMWQLNFMHWDLCNALVEQNHKDPEKVELNAHDDLDRIWDDRKKVTMEDGIGEQFKVNSDKLLIKSENWLDDLDEVLDYLEIDKTQNMQYNIDNYAYLMEQKRDWVQKTFAHKI